MKKEARRVEGIELRTKIIEQQAMEDLYHEAQYLSELVRWAYGKLHQRTFNDMNDALMLDRMKMYLEHGHAG